MAIFETQNSVTVSQSAETEEELIGDVAKKLSQLPKNRNKKTDLTKAAADVVHLVQKKSSPLPDPAVLAQYNNIEPGLANRIMKMAEKEQENDHDVNKFIHADQGKRFNILREGQFFGFVALISLIGCGTYLLTNKQIVPGYVTISVSVIALLKSIFSKNKPDKS